MDPSFIHDQYWHGGSRKENGTNLTTGSDLWGTPGSKSLYWTHQQAHQEELKTQQLNTFDTVWFTPTLQSTGSLHTDQHLLFDSYHLLRQPVSYQNTSAMSPTHQGQKDKEHKLRIPSLGLCWDIQEIKERLNSNTWRRRRKKKDWFMSGIKQLNTNRNSSCLNHILFLKTLFGNH